MKRLALVAFLFLSCQGAAGKHRDFSGMWDTPFGHMHLVQDGGKVKGRYRSDRGCVDGKITGDTLYFTWSDPDGRGDGFFVLSADGKALEGAYRREGEAEWEGSWWGVKLSR